MTTRVETPSERAHRLIPGGAHTYSKDDAHFPPNAPPMISWGSGATVYEYGTGRPFLDWGMGLRSTILGHAYPEVIERVESALWMGSNHTRPTIIEGELAERLTSLIPCGADGAAKFGKNGSDATTAAVRLARAYTGRQKILVCDGSFHASDDWWLSTQPLSAGTVEQGTRVFPYNDAQTLGDALRTHEYAAVIMEPMMFEWPAPGYLEDVRWLCSDTGTVLIFDEIISGFRFDLRGAQHVFGVTPDLATFGKAMGNGFAVSALVGQRDLMMTPGVHLLSSTHGGDTHDLAAALATIDVIEREDVCGYIGKIGKRLQDGLRAAGYDVRGHPCSPNIVWPSDKRWPPRDFSKGPSARPAGPPPGDGSERMAFVAKMCDAGILMPYIAPSFSHTEEDVDRTVEAAQS